MVANLFLISIPSQNSYSTLLQASISFLLEVSYGSSEHCKALIDAGAVPKLISIVNMYKNTHVYDALDTLINLSKDNLDDLMNEGLVEIICTYMKTHNLETYRLISIMLIIHKISNAAESFTAVEPFVAPMIQIFTANVNDEKIAIDCGSLFVVFMEKYAAFFDVSTLAEILELSCRILEILTEPASLSTAYLVASIVLKLNSTIAGDEIIDAGIAAAYVRFFACQCQCLSTVALSSSLTLLNGDHSEMYMRKVVDSSLIEKISQVLGDAQFEDKSKKLSVNLLKNIIVKVDKDDEKTEIIFGTQQNSLWTNFAGVLKSQYVKLVKECLRLIDCIGPPNDIARHDIKELFTTVGIFDTLTKLVDHKCDAIKKLAAEIQGKYSR